MSKEDPKYSAWCPECGCGLESDNQFVIQCLHGVWATEGKALTGLLSKPLHIVAAHQAKLGKERHD